METARCRWSTRWRSLSSHVIDDGPRAPLNLSKLHFAGSATGDDVDFQSQMKPAVLFQFTETVTENQIRYLMKVSTTKNIGCLFGLLPLAYTQDMAITTFPITLSGQYCRRHLMGQRVVRDISVVRSCWSIWSLYSESNTYY